MGEVVRTDAQGGEQSGEQHQHAHAAHPVGECPPEEDATGLGLDVSEDGGTGVVKPDTDSNRQSTKEGKVPEK